jgi:DNA polymerase I-like protein with 3'-5' exonuclease and polymerase domains
MMTPPSSLGGKLLPQGLVLNEEDLQAFVDYALTQDSFSFDVEAAYEYRSDPNRNTLTWISLATHGSCIVVPMGHLKGEETGITKVTAYYGGTGPRAGKPYQKTVKLYDEPPEQLDLGTVFSILKPLFASTTIIKSGYGMIYDLISVGRHMSFISPPPYFDPLIGFWLLDENKFTRGLKEMTELFYDFSYDDENVGKEVESHPFSVVAYYAFLDAKFNFLHMLSVKEKLEQENLTSIFNLEMEVLNTLIGMRMAGARVDVPSLKNLRKDLTKRLETDKIEVIKAAGRKDFNVNSNYHKQDALYLPPPAGYGLKPWKLTDGGKKAKKAGLPLTQRHYSTDDSVLESYAGNPLADALRAYGDTDKVLNTYVNSWLGLEDKEAKVVGGRIYTDFVQYGARTGRMASRKPNLQNVPRGNTELGKLLRSVFIADGGCQLICADYSQIEYVVLAHYIEEGALYEGFLKGIDPHTQTAAIVFGKNPEDVTSSERQAAKSLNFAITYGAGPNKVASMMGRDVKEARKLLSVHSEMFPEVYGFKEQVISLARRRKPEHYITTLLGRKRRIPLLVSSDEGIRMGAERQIFNSLIQGSAADILKKAMVRVDSLLPDGCCIELNVHDELLVNAPYHLVDGAVDAVRKGMTGPGIQKHLKVPLKIDLHIGNSWSEAKGP